MTMMPIALLMTALFGAGAVYSAVKLAGDIQEGRYRLGFLGLASLAGSLLMLALILFFLFGGGTMH
jgi:hypothetical protein